MKESDSILVSSHEPSQSFKPHPVQDFINIYIG